MLSTFSQLKLHYSATKHQIQIANPAFKHCTKQYVSDPT